MSSKLMSFNLEKTFLGSYDISGYFRSLATYHSLDTDQVSRNRVIFNKDKLVELTRLVHVRWICNQGHWLST